ncbi:hypothetical protein PUN28_014688 [Cardiocondyla obscurior]|uniref:Uncharacterized protein n=1 Tax=Cardiocondyla obscurior TaxID=286306 RepID=A0AAW2EW36_9HYME
MHKRLLKKKKTRKKKEKTKKGLRRIARHCRITYKPYTCIQRALISLATDASSSHRFVIKCAFHLAPPSPPRFCDTQDNTRVSLFYHNVGGTITRST